MSSLVTSSPVLASTFWYLMRLPVRLLSWLKLTVSFSDVAECSSIGQVTRERRRLPFQYGRGAIGHSTNATGYLTPKYKPITRFRHRERTANAIRLRPVPGPNRLIQYS